MTHELHRPDHPPIIAVLENVRSLWNVGSMFRSADGAGLERLVICGYTAHPPRKEISKTALGAEEVVAWEYWSSAAEACRSLRAEGYRVLALETGAESSEIESTDLGEMLAFVVGNEVEGITSDTLAECEARIRLPMLGQKDSLNVAVAFGIAAYELRARTLGHRPDRVLRSEG
jgi:23S rRNA (guanosine2251-2'-O)-methyltransferase